jgi:cytochrome c-type biogenesis protein CcmH/NrfG
MTGFYWPAWFIFNLWACIEGFRTGRYAPGYVALYAACWVLVLLTQRYSARKENDKAEREARRKRLHLYT